MGFTDTASEQVECGFYRYGLGASCVWVIADKGLEQIIPALFLAGIVSAWNRSCSGWGLQIQAWSTSCVGLTTTGLTMLCVGFAGIGLKQI